jgi:hypothetical protein
MITKFNELKPDDDFSNLGFKLEKSLKLKSKKNGYFDFQYTNDDETVTFEFYFDYLDKSNFSIDFIKNLYDNYPNVRIISGSHDEYEDVYQIAICLTYDIGITD